MNELETKLFNSGFLSLHYIMFHVNICEYKGNLSLKGGNNMMYVKYISCKRNDNNIDYMYGETFYGRHTAHVTLL